MLAKSWQEYLYSPCAVHTCEVSLWDIMGSLGKTLISSEITADKIKKTLAESRKTP